MTRPRRTARPLLALLLLPLAGCDGAVTVNQRLAREWVGRPETAAERVLREWPGRRGADGKIDPDNPEVVRAVEEAPKTDLEGASPVVVAMRLDELGGAELTLAGEKPLEATWSVSTVEGRRAQLEIVVEEEAGSTRRRFEIEFLRQGEGFVLQESGSDPRFGRLLFKPKGTPASEPPLPPSPAE